MASAVPDPLVRLRALCTAFADVEERLSHGEPSWFIQTGRQFAMFADHHHDDRVAVWLEAAPGAQQALVAAASDRFFVPAYVGHRGWLGVYLDVPVDWKELAAIVRDAHETAVRKGRR